MRTNHHFKLMLIGMSVTLDALLAAPRPNYDASLELATHHATRHALTNQVLQRRSTAAQVNGYPSLDDPQLGVSTFLWAQPHALAAASTSTTAPPDHRQRVERTTHDFLAHHAARLGLTKHSIASARLHEVHDLNRGPVIARYQQMHQGVEVFGRRLNVMLDRALQPVAAAGYFAPDDNAPDARVTSLAAHDEFRQDLTQALTIAVADLGGQLDPTALAAIATHGAYHTFRVTQSSGGTYRLIGTPRGKRVYFPLDGYFIPAWYLEITLHHNNTNERLAYGYVVAATDGTILFRNNHLAHNTFSYRVFGDEELPFDLPFGNENLPLVVLDTKLDLPRVAVPMNLVTVAHGPITTADPWLPAGARYTVGNNVDAYADLGGVDGFQAKFGDFRAQVTSTAMFDYPVAINADPTTTSARNAGIVNVFYLNNFLHDWWYDHGFNEAAGNAQSNNYGRGGLDEDPIIAETQDYSDYANADMDTPADGKSPKMQMYLWSGATLNSTTLTATGMGALTVNNADFGAARFDLVGTITSVTPADGCAALTTPLNGQIALIARGDCTFVVKALNAQRAGARGVVIANNINDGTAPGMAGSDAAITIPVLSTSFQDGQRITNALRQGPVTITMHKTQNVDIDGALDNTIVAHEWFHYVSNRLVADSNGLFNQQGIALGEGWSDFCALLLVARAADATLAGNAGFSGAYPLATYVEPSSYFGIRRAPYSTNPAIFPMTFKHIANSELLPTSAPLAPVGGKNAEVHNAGEIWANTLWDFYVALLNDPRHSFAQAQERMMDYLIAGLKLTPAAPTFLEARNALFAAVKATDQQDLVLAARSFAKYGMGIDAVAPARTSLNNNGLVESFVALAGAYEITQATLDTTKIRGCDTDQVLDAGETVPLRITIRNTGTSPLTQPIRARVTSDAAVVLGNQGYLRFGAFDAKGLARTQLPVTLQRAAIADTIKLKVTFDPSGATADAVREPPPNWVEAQVNYDLQQSLTEDNVEQTAATMMDWSRLLISGTGEGWQVTTKFDDRYHTGQTWFIPDNDTATNAVLTSPPIIVGQSAFQFAFDTAFQFEMEQWSKFSYDGGVVEIMPAGGKWQDVLAAGGRFTRGGYNSKITAFAQDQNQHARLGFGRASGGLTQHTIDFGVAFAGQTVRLRFRAVSDDAVGDLGWLVDNIRVIGASNAPFSEAIANLTSCGL